MPSGMVRRRSDPAALRQTGGTHAVQKEQDRVDSGVVGGGGDGVDLADGHVGLVKHLPDQAGQYLDMRAGGDFGDDAAERAMGVVLADHRLGEDLPIASDQRRRAVVARGFKGENESHSRQPLPEIAR